MFSYRHSFHAGNHGDVLKHLTLIATVRYLMHKPSPLLLIDTHAGAGAYDLGDAWALKSGEGAEGYQRLLTACRQAPSEALPEALTAYLDWVRQLGAEDAAGARFYPGSPALLYGLMNAPERREVHDRLKLFELHPTVSEILARRVQSWQAGRRVVAEASDGFAALKRLLPPAVTDGGTRRALVLMDPPYEMKTDYAQVVAAMEGALQRCAVGTYLIWYPIIARAEAHELPRRLRTLAQNARRPWLHATLSVGNVPSKDVLQTGVPQRQRLSASGVFVINPPYVLAGELRAALPHVTEILRRGPGSNWSVEAAG